MRTKGLTLIEVLFTLVLIGILSLLGIASFARWIGENEKKVILDEVRIAVQYSRIQALSRGNPVTLSPLDVKQNWSKGIVLTQYNKAINQVELLYQWQWDHPHWLLEWSGISSSNKIILSNNPVSAISNGHFDLTNYRTKERVVIILNRLGRLRIENCLNKASHPCSRAFLQ